MLEQIANHDHIEPSADGAKVSVVQIEDRHMINHARRFGGSRWVELDPSPMDSRVKLLESLPQTAIGAPQLQHPFGVSGYRGQELQIQSVVVATHGVISLLKAQSNGPIRKTSTAPPAHHAEKGKAALTSLEDWDRFSHLNSHFCAFVGSADERLEFKAFLPSNLCVQRKNCWHRMGKFIQICRLAPEIAKRGASPGPSGRLTAVDAPKDAKFIGLAALLPLDVN
jgi:hypothetical protein